MAKCMSEAEPDPVFDITIGSSSVSTSVRVNGQDVSRYIKGLTINCTAGSLTTVTLVAHASVRGKLDAAITDVQVVNG